MHKIAARFLCTLHNEQVFADLSHLWDIERMFTDLSHLWDIERIFTDLSHLWDTEHLFELPHSCPKKWTERMFLECGAQEP